LLISSSARHALQVCHPAFLSTRILHCLLSDNPHLSLCTTYKKRCLSGLAQADPSRPDACHKPSRGAFSKFCSDECGVKYMQMRIDAWANKGGNKEKLWESVKAAEPREGLVISADQVQTTEETVDAQSFSKNAILPKISKIQREVQRLSAQLEAMGLEREDIKKQLEVILWRERLTELAAERSERLDTCGWDQRLCFGDEEWSDFGVGVLESYEEREKAEDHGDGTLEGAREWWCPGKKKCDRHAG
jgi:COMPASS component SPP1